jgi:hypothetical protein
MRRLAASEVPGVSRWTTTRRDVTCGGCLDEIAPRAPSCAGVESLPKAVKRRHVGIGAAVRKQARERLRMFPVAALLVASPRPVGFAAAAILGGQCPRQRATVVGIQLADQAARLVDILRPTCQMDDEHVARAEQQHPRDAVPDPEGHAATDPFELGGERLDDVLPSSDLHQVPLERIHAALFTRAPLSARASIANRLLE